MKNIFFLKNGSNPSTADFDDLKKIAQLLEPGGEVHIAYTIEFDRGTELPLPAENSVKLLVERLAPFAHDLEFRVHATVPRWNGFVGMEKMDVHAVFRDTGMVAAKHRAHQFVRALLDLTKLSLVDRREVIMLVKENLRKSGDLEKVAAFIREFNELLGD